MRAGLEIGDKVGWGAFHNFGEYYSNLREIGGTAFINEAPIGYVPAPNRTSAAGGVGATFTAADWEQAIRHSIASCASCHGENLAGNSDPASPSGPNITQGGELQNWAQEDFVTAMRTGIKPSGVELGGEMPWMSHSGMTDTELVALWTYISSPLSRRCPTTCPDTPYLATFLCWNPPLGVDLDTGTLMLR